MTSADSFRKLHGGHEVLVLPNAWDAGSARLIESLGASAIATTSAGVAWSHGYPDGDALPLDLVLATAEEIARVVRVPLSIDLEGGYSDDPAQVGALATRVIDAGVVGINIEDGTGEPDLLAAKIGKVRASAARSGVELFVNARCDVYLAGIASDDAAIEEVLRRAAIYRDAGCDGLFVPCLTEAAAIRAIASGIQPLPLNVMLMPNLPDLNVLRDLGVRRLSCGSALAEAALGRARELAASFLVGNVEHIYEGAADYGANQALFSQ
jgi:2-methylisocitrate lyase-like PEP mutase family enzyme